jgi:hypothetical protein
LVAHTIRSDWAPIEALAEKSNSNAVVATKAAMSPPHFVTPLQENQPSKEPSRPAKSTAATSPGDYVRTFGRNILAGPNPSSTASAPIRSARKPSAVNHREAAEAVAILDPAAVDRRNHGQRDFSKERAM